MKKILLSALSLVLVGAGGFLAYLYFRSPEQRPAPDLRVEATPERLARGKYIFENLADCTGCHSERDMSKVGGPVIAGRVGVGGAFPPELGFPGSVVAPNLTPDRETGLGAWTDGEKLRAIREGVGRDGKALFPFMPYTAFRDMSDEDAYSVIAYMNSLPPVRNALPRTKLDFPVNLLIKSAPKPLTTAVAPPDRSSTLKYGAYLANMAGCIECHTPQEKGARMAGMEYAGGMEFRIGKLGVTSANITTDVETGIGSWSEQRFLDKFHGFATMDASNAPAAVQANFTLMPWLGLSRLPDEDLKAIYAFLRTVKPVRNAVDTHKPLSSL